MTNQFLIACVLLAGIMGCGNPIPEVPQLAAVSPEPESEIITNKQQLSWFRTSREKPTQIIATRLTIPDVMEADSSEIPIAPYVQLDEEGILHAPPSSGTPVVHADGQGFGYQGSIQVDDVGSGEHFVVLVVHYSWTTEKQVKGELFQTVRMSIGEPLDVKWNEGCRLEVSWRKVEP